MRALLVYKWAFNVHLYKVYPSFGIALISFILLIKILIWNFLKDLQINTIFIKFLNENTHMQTQIDSSDAHLGYNTTGNSAQTLWVSSW